MVSFLARSFVIIAGLLIFPIIIGNYWAFQIGSYFLYAIAALGVSICWGQAGFLSLGQAVFFGLSAYVAGLSLIHFFDSWFCFVLLPFAVIIPGIISYLIGIAIFSGRRESGPYFTIITLSFSLLAFQIAMNWESITGGFNGLQGIPSLPGFPGMDPFLNIYYLAAAALIVGMGLVYWLINAPVGVLWRAISQNEQRVAYLGFNTAKLKALAFGVSGILAGIAGVCYAPQQNIVTPESCGFLLSTELVVWTAVGGRKSLSGPILGAVAIGALSAELRDKIEYWEAILAAVFIFIVLYAPNGISGLYEPIKRLSIFKEKRKRESIVAPERVYDAEKIVLDIEDVYSSANKVRILNGLSLQLERPGIYCIIGPNGAGKTSAFNMITGELNVQKGALRLNGRKVTGRSAHAMTLEGISRKFQIPCVFPDLSIKDNLQIALWTGRTTVFSLLKPSTRCWTTPFLKKLKTIFRFLEDDDRLARELSHGQLQILELVMALITEPKMLFLDEPCGGLSSEETVQVMDTIRLVAANLNIPVVVIEHDMTLVKKLADHIFVLHQGSLIAEGCVEDIQKNKRVEEVYVGVTK